MKIERFYFGLYKRFRISKLSEEILSMDKFIIWKIGVGKGKNDDNFTRNKKVAYYENKYIVSLRITVYTLT